ncbi:thioredoxin family protein [Seonamhaeicola marinus]|uniref:Thioredoxin domain-containing protein n=1 Tax=Seonamhaeicola marinus TaxID=1912246 RepID=A0A5D0HF87_9FLAO|nr:thioredoxin family protein [Seonamhaeicola marinus]TYA70054.1 hypothetical protein FUA24_22475 [Seonamhaeicola marinus]
MKRTVILFIILLNLQFGFSQTSQNALVNREGKELLLGKIDKSDLTKNSFKAWFLKNYDDYLENKKVVKLLKDSLSHYEIKAFLGTWCGDSKREVPRFYKILDQAKFPKTQLEVIAVDRTKEAYKQSPNHEEKGLNIHRVPTFIFYKDGKEINRIVESPKETLENDILKIVTQKKYTPNYFVVRYLDHLLQTKSVEALREETPNLIPRLSEFVKGSRELNTYGYALLRSKETEKALFVFELNTKIFPYKPNVYDSLGEAQFETGNNENALRSYYKVLSITPNDENALKMIEKIKSTI